MILWIVVLDVPIVLVLLFLLCLTNGARCKVPKAAWHTVQGMLKTKKTQQHQVNLDAT